MIPWILLAFITEVPAPFWNINIGQVASMVVIIGGVISIKSVVQAKAALDQDMRTKFYIVYDWFVKNIIEKEHHHRSGAKE